MVFQREYNLIMSVSDYCDEVNRGKTFATFTQQYLKEKTPFQVKWNLLLVLSNLNPGKVEFIIGVIKPHSR